MNYSMLCSILRKLPVLMTLVVAGIAGCGDSTIKASKGPYRTITTDPLRDTESARRHYQAGLEHLNNHEVDKAIKDFERALAADVQFGPAHNCLGRAHYMNEDWYEAAWEFEYARKYLPKHPQPLNNLALLYERDGQYDRAIDYYRKAVAMAPRDIQYRANLARAMIRRGDRNDEVKDLLQDITEEDSRADWLIWAKRWSTRIAGSE